MRKENRYKNNYMLHKKQSPPYIIRVGCKLIV